MAFARESEHVAKPVGLQVHGGGSACVGLGSKARSRGGRGGWGAGCNGGGGLGCGGRPPPCWGLGGRGIAGAHGVRGRSHRGAGCMRNGEGRGAPSLARRRGTRGFFPKGPRGVLWTGGLVMAILPAYGARHSPISLQF